MTYSKVRKIFLYVIAVLLAVFLAVLVGVNIKDRFIPNYISVAEKIAMVLLIDVIFVSLASPITDKGLKRPKTWIITVLLALLVAAMAILINAGWHLYRFYDLFGGRETVTFDDYIALLKDDLFYSVGFISRFRYIGVFASYFAVFFVSHFRGYLFKKPLEIMKKFLRKE